MEYCIGCEPEDYLLDDVVDEIEDAEEDILASDSTDIDLIGDISSDDVDADEYDPYEDDSYLNDDDQDTYVDEVDDDIEVEPDSYTAEDYTGSADGSNIHTNRPSTNPNLGKKAIKANHYSCIFSTDNNPHETFIKPNGKPYMEAHHLIPVVKQSLFRKKLDTIANIVPVCPLCHRKLHHGRKPDVRKMLDTLLTMRKDALKQSGLEVTLDQLASFY